ncbi:plastocyanin/azurin family copper-binding protein [Geminocystis sp. NIES-3709]|uniref:plastocyanin/azurin family copper-binding protein n=1 Tax=Geminocystis sp. NIES-3709 TaxID=1617448 RepID=UPI0005FC7C7B|nr:plastocyanin/azurin family copper-binding protein [Geminocystis sp. NIES-3709]BAQ63556.1 blue-copper-protein-like protein [Geminocystis sp. NIES-3709]
MKKLLIIISINILFFCNFIIDVQANTDYEIIDVSLGNEQGQLIFTPNELKFSTGKKYKLVLNNPSPEKHYFTAKDFADASWTQKVQAGKVEVKGAIHELELKPEGIAEWVFIPEKKGSYDLYCSIKGHKEAGMKGIITIN